MKLYTLQQTIKTELYQACVKYITLIQHDLAGGKIYGFNVYSYGFEQGMYVAVATVESLERKQKAVADHALQAPKTYLEICADEWEYIGLHSAVFLSLSEHLIALYDVLYEGCEFDDETDFQAAEAHITKTIPEAIILTLIKLKQDGVFNTALFEKDLFLGYQVADSADNEQVAVYVQASARLNSPYWHDKLLGYQQYCLAQNT